MSDKIYFQQDWLTIPQFKDCLSAGKGITKAYCKRCATTFELSNMGIQAVKSHLLLTAGKFTLFLSCIML